MEKGIDRERERSIELPDAAGRTKIHRPRKMLLQQEIKNKRTLRSSELIIFPSKINV